MLLCPQPATPEDSAELFNRVGLHWQQVFAHSHSLGIKNVLGTEMPLAMPPPPPPPPPPTGATLPLQLWFSASRNDHFITTTDCAECDGLYVRLGVTGWLWANNESGSTPLCTFAGALPNGQIDNKLAVCPPGNAGVVRVEGYAPPAGTAGSAPLTQFTNGQDHHWAADAAWAANATAAGFTAGATIAAAFTDGPPLPPTPDAFDFYVGTFQRLEALLGDTLDYYWSWT